MVGVVVNVTPVVQRFPVAFKIPFGGFFTVTVNELDWPQAVTVSTQVAVAAPPFHCTLILLGDKGMMVPNALLNVHV